MRLALAVGLLLVALRGVPASASDALLARGRAVYEANCAVCHGERGDGAGHAAHMLRVQPRDFTRGLFKFRSTPSGVLPTDEDLLATVTRGLRWTAMVGRPDLPEPDRRAVVQYVKTFVARAPGSSRRAAGCGRKRSAPRATAWEAAATARRRRG